MALTLRAVGLLALSLATLLVAPVRADDTLSAGLREEIVAVKRPGLIPLDLEATLMRPPGDGPFPLVIVSHASGTEGYRHRQARARYPLLARELLARGYAVAIPERTGFAASGGQALTGGCNPQGVADASVADVTGAIASLAARADIDAHRVVVVGFGWGGVISVAAGARRDPAIVGTINVEGHSAKDTCANWDLGLVDAMTAFGQQAPVPSLWFYGSNNTLVADATWHRMADAYVQSGATMRLVTGERYGNDASGVFGKNASLDAWLPEFDRFFRQLGLPFDVRQRVVVEDHESPPPSPSGFARVDDAAAVPGLNERGRAAYAAFLTKAQPRAFALGPHGRWFWRAGDPGAMRLAVADCEIATQGQPCELYAVDDQVVWRAPAASN